ncbi:hypothetical protein ES708_17051 [subsurface metagenome]
MLHRKRTILLFAVLVMVFCISSVYAADDDPVTVPGILNAAGCPLTAEQQKILDAITPGESSRESRSAMNEMFDDKQMAALKEKLGVSPSRGDRPERLRSLFQVIVLEKEGVPLTEKQVSDIKNLSMEQGGFRQMGEIYTDAQRTALEKYGSGRGSGRGNR